MTPDELIVRRPYSDVILNLKGSEEGRTLSEIIEKGVLSSENPDKCLSVSRVSRILKRLIEEGIVTKTKGRFVLTARMWDVYAKGVILARMRESDGVALSAPGGITTPPAVQNGDDDPKPTPLRVVWGDFPTSINLNEKLDNLLSEIETILMNESLRMAVTRLEQEVISLLDEKRFSLEAKAYALAHAREILHAELEQSRISDSRIEALNLSGVRDELIEGRGLGYLTDRDMKRRVKRILVNRERVPNWHIKEKTAVRIRARVERPFEPLRTGPLLAIQPRIDYGDRQ